MKKNGFTLIEIVLAIAFLLIVTLMVVPNMYTMISRANEKQLAKTEEMIVEASKLYLGRDQNLAYNVKRCGRAELTGAVNATTCPPENEELYKTLYISLYDLVRLDLISGTLKDPTQNNDDFDYSKIILVWYSTTENKYMYELKERTEVFEPDKKTLLTQTYLEDFDDFWYSGLRWQAYSITNTADSTENQVPPAEDDYINLYLVDPNLNLSSLSCGDLEGKLNNYKKVLAKRSDGSYCKYQDATHKVTIVLKNRQMFLGGFGVVDDPITNDPFILLGDTFGNIGQKIYERPIGEYVIVSSTNKRIIGKENNNIILEDYTTISGDLKIITDVDGNLGIGTFGRPYSLGG